MTELAEAMTEQFAAGAYPYLVELTTEYVLKAGYDFSNEFGFGLALILDGLSDPTTPGDRVG